jgi:poly(A) polymerase
MPIKKIFLSDSLLRISHVFGCYNMDPYLVGGFVRNYYLDKSTADVDIAVKGKSLDILRKIAAEADGKYVLLDEVNKVVRIVFTDDASCNQIDITLFGDTIESDLARRDFSVNAMAVRLEDFIHNSTNPVDPFSGMSDLRKKKIRAVNDCIFINDPARLLRAVRLAAELKFSIAPGTVKLIKANSGLVRAVAGERIRDELVKIVNLEGAAEHLQYLDRLGLLCQMIPEIRKMKRVKQPREHYWDVYRHSLQTVQAVESLLYQGKVLFLDRKIRVPVFNTVAVKEHFSEEISSSSTRSTLLKIGALFHDIAKPQTKKKEKTGRIRFIGHPQQGADISADILKRLRFSNKEINIVEKLVYYHLRPVQLSNTGLPTERAIYRFFKKAGNDAHDILLLALADYLAAKGPDIDAADWKNHKILIEYILMEHKTQIKIANPEKLIDGHDIMTVFDLTPGPLIGKLLDSVHEFQAMGKVVTQEDAISFLKKKLKKST